MNFTLDKTLKNALDAVCEGHSRSLFTLQKLENNRMKAF